MIAVTGWSVSRGDEIEVLTGKRERGKWVIGIFYAWTRAFFFFLGKKNSHDKREGYCSPRSDISLSSILVGARDRNLGSVISHTPTKNPPLEFSIHISPQTFPLPPLPTYPTSPTYPTYLPYPTSPS